MSTGFGLTEEQKRAFAEILSSKSSVSAELTKQSAKFDAFKSILGADRIVTEIKAKLPLSYKGEVLFTCDPSNSKEVLIALAKYAKQGGGVPVLVLMNYNYKTIVSELAENGIRDGYYIIDTVTKSIASVEDEGDVIFVDSLRNLTQLQIRVLNVIEKDSNTVFVFDSLPMLELYHEWGVVFKFVYSMTKLLHKNNSTGLFISGKKDFSLRLGQFFDESIELKKYI